MARAFLKKWNQRRGTLASDEVNNQLVETEL